MIGIYKIKSPLGRIYIGQSINIENRFKKYKNNCKTQTRLKRSFDKYGINEHIFIIIEECDIEILNERERYWQDYYNVLEDGLNCRLTKTSDKSGRISDETKKILSEQKKGIKLNRPQWNKGKKCPVLSIAFKGIRCGEKNGMFGKKQSEYNKKRTSECNKGRGKIILDISNGIFYNSAVEAAEILQIKIRTLHSYLNGTRKNKTTLMYV